MQASRQTHVVGVRLSPALVATIDQECEDLMETFPGREFGRGDFLRVALAELLETRRFRVKVRERVRNDP